MTLDPGGRYAAKKRAEAEEAECEGDIRYLATIFCRRLRDAMPDEDWQMLRRRTRAGTPKNVCWSHDYCDANVVMAEAFGAVTGREINLQSEADCALFNAAWNYAKSHAFNL